MSSSVAPRHSLSTRQVSSIRAVMQLFIEDDIASGESVSERRYCHACELRRPAAGFIQYDRYAICNACATNYELARATGLAEDIGQYVDAGHAGETLEHTTGNTQRG
jgi:formate dehydrogenase maturation protein FdhE